MVFWNDLEPRVWVKELPMIHWYDWVNLWVWSLLQSGNVSGYRMSVTWWDLSFVNAKFPILSDFADPYGVEYGSMTHVCKVGFQRQCRQLRQSTSKVDLPPILTLWRWSTTFSSLSSRTYSRVNWLCEIFLEAVGVIRLAEAFDWMKKPQSAPPLWN